MLRRTKAPGRVHIRQVYWHNLYLYYLLDVQSINKHVAWLG